MVLCLRSWKNVTHKILVPCVVIERPETVEKTEARAKAQKGIKKIKIKIT